MYPTTRMIALLSSLRRKAIRLRDWSLARSYECQITRLKADLAAGIKQVEYTDYVR